MFDVLNRLKFAIKKSNQFKQLKRQTITLLQPTLNIAWDACAYTKRNFLFFDGRLIKGRNTAVTMTAVLESIDAKNLVRDYLVSTCDPLFDLDITTGLVIIVYKAIGQFQCSYVTHIILYHVLAVSMP